MERMNVFHRIFHEDLHPFINQRSREYYLEHFDKNNYSLDSLDLVNLSDQELKFYYYHYTLEHTLKEIKRGLYNHVFSLAEEDGNIKSLILIQKTEAEWLSHHKGEGKHKHKSRLQLFSLQRKRVASYGDEALTQAYEQSLHQTLIKLSTQ